MLLAARFADWWNIPDANFTDYKSRVAILHQHCYSIGRDPDSIRLTWFGRLVVGKTQAEALQRGRGRWVADNAFVGSPEQVAEQLQQFVELGTDGRKMSKSYGNTINLSDAEPIVRQKLKTMVKNTLPSF